MLEALTGQGGTTCSCTQEETTCHLIGCCPDGVTGALESEHRVEDVERNHSLAVGGIRGTCGDEGSHGAGLINTFVQDLSLWSFTVGEHQIVVHWHIVLAVWVVDLQGWEPRVQTEGTGLIRDDRNQTFSDVLIAHQFLEGTHSRHRGSDLLLAGTLTDRTKLVDWWNLNWFVVFTTLRQVTT